MNSWANYTADIVTNDMDLALDTNMLRHQLMEIPIHDHLRVSFLGMRLTGPAIVWSDDILHLWCAQHRICPIVVCLPS
jgi:hypothetical protein